MIDLGLDALLEEGMQLRNNGDFENALRRFVAAIEQKPSFLLSYLEAGKTEEQAGNKLAALSWYDRAQKVCPTNFWPYYLSSEIMREKYDYDLSLNYLSQGLVACKGYVSNVEYKNLIKSYMDVKSKLHILSKRELATLLAAKAAPGRELNNALRISLVKDESDVIYHSLEASYWVGIRYYVIADNGSSDQTKIKIQKFASDHSDCVVFIVDDPVVGYYQASKMMGLARFGVTVFKGCGKNVDWIFPLDADECIHVGHGFDDLHSVLNSEAHQNSKMLAYYLCDSATDNPLESVRDSASLDDVFTNFAFYYSRLVRKVAFRYSENSFLEYGNHYCDDCVNDVSEVIDGSRIGVFIKHYPVRSLQQLRSKIINGGQSISSVESSNIGIHWRRDYESYKNFGEQFIEKKLSDYCATTKDFSIR